jgi:hypothetical protein
VRRIRDASAVDDPTALPADDLCLLLLDDAHLMPRPALQQIEEAVGARRLVLSFTTLSRTAERDMKPVASLQ